MNILEKANQIIFERAEEKQREYGPFDKSMEEAAKVASILCNKEITTEDCYNVLIALKLVRQSNAHKEDNLLDAVAYMASLNDYKNKNHE